MHRNIKEYLLFFIYRSFIAPIIFFMPVFLEDKGISGLKSGILMGSIYVSGIVMTFPAGILNDRNQPRHLMILSLLIGAVSMFLFSGFSSFETMLVVFILYGIYKNLFQVSFDSMFFKEIIKGEGCVHVGRYQSVLSLAAVLGMLITTFFVGYFSFEQFYMFAGAVNLAAVFLASRFRNTPVRAVPVSHYRKQIFKPEIIVFGFLVFLFAMHWGAEDTCYGLFLRHYLGASSSLSSIYIMSEFITLGITAYLISLAVDRYKLSLRWIFIVGVIISGAALILKINKVFAISMAMRMLHGVGDGLVMVVIYYGISKVFELDKVGGSMSLVILTQIAGAFTGAVIFSKVGSSYGYHISFGINGVILIITGVLFAVYSLIEFQNRR